MGDEAWILCMTVLIVDDFSRECLRIEVDTSLSGHRVARVLNQLAETRGLPKYIVVDNGPSSQAEPCWNGRTIIPLTLLLLILESQHRMLLLRALMEAER